MATVESMHHHHIPAALALADEAFGAGYLDHGHLTGRIGSQSTFALVAMAGPRMVGLVTASLGAPDVPDSQREALAALLPGPVDSIDTVVTASQARGTGVGTLLLDEMLRLLGHFGAGHVATLAWVRGGRAPVAGPLSRLGHRQVGTLHRLWLQDSLERGYDCPDCGRPCACSAKVFLGPAAVDLTAAG